MLRDLFFDIAKLGLPAEVQIIPWVLAVIWGVYFLERIGVLRMAGVDLRGDITTAITGSLGHQSFKHILSNSIGAVVLLWVYMVYTPEPWTGLIVMYLGSAGVFWLLGPSDSDQARGLSCFLYALNGWLLVFLYTYADKVDQPLLWLPILGVAISTLKGSMPSESNAVRNVAWSGHLSGLAVGLAWSLYDFGYLVRWTA